jgi:hypothetical protein
MEVPVTASSAEEVAAAVLRRMKSGQMLWPKKSPDSESDTVVIAGFMQDELEKSRADGVSRTQKACHKAAAEAYRRALQVITGEAWAKP